MRLYLITLTPTVTGRTLIIFVVYLSSWMDFRLSPCTLGFWSHQTVIDADFLHGFEGLLAGKQTQRDAKLLITDFTHSLFNSIIQLHNPLGHYIIEYDLSALNYFS